MNKKTSETNFWKPFNVCLAVTFIAALGAYLGLKNHNSLWVLFFILPAVVYEVIRTEPGASTKTSSILLLLIVVAEIIFVLFGINYDLAKLLGEEEKYVAGYSIPLGDIKTFGPMLSAILASLLIFRTYGPYTRWLSVIIALGSLLTIYLLNPLFFEQALKLIVGGLFDKLNYAF